MSAFVVSKQHIDLMVTTARTYDYMPSQFSVMDEIDRNLLGRMLWTENERSVSYRYPGNETLPGTDGYSDASDYQYDPTRVLTPVETLKAISCYKYQSCEHPGWETSDAHTFCAWLQSETISKLPGYDAAPWGFDK